MQKNVFFPSAALYVLFLLCCTLVLSECCCIIIVFWFCILLLFYVCHCVCFLYARNSKYMYISIMLDTILSRVAWKIQKTKKKWEKHANIERKRGKIAIMQAFSAFNDAFSLFLLEHCKYEIVCHRIWKNSDQKKNIIYTNFDRCNIKNISFCFIFCSFKSHEQCKNLRKYVGFNNLWPHRLLFFDVFFVILSLSLSFVCFIH